MEDMIKRRFYKQEHGDKDAASGSSSSSDSELDAEASVDTEEEEDDDNMVIKSRKKDQPCSSSSGYESEDSSGNEVNLDASGLPTNDDGSGGENYKQDVIDTRVSADNHSDKNAITNDVLDCVLKSKSVFKCKLCPRIVCLTEETLKAHLKSKRHARSEKLLKEGRLKMMLNSDGEIEGEDGETHQERHASTLALLQSNKNAAQESKKNKGRQRQRKRLRKKTSDDSVPKKPKKSAKKRPKSDI